MADIEKVQIDYDYLIEYLEDQQNVVGATTSTTLRTVDTISGDTAYVRKFGTDYLITDVTDIENPVDPNMQFVIRALDGTILGSRIGGAAYVDGSTLATAQGCYLEVVASGGAVTVIAGITVDTDVDPGGINFVCPAETVADGDTLRLYLSDTSSTYYDADLSIGGDRHTPVLGNSRLPYLSPVTAYAALNSANDGVVVLDSATYDFSGLDLNRATTFLLAASGQTPTIQSGIGARQWRSVQVFSNNINTIYVSQTSGDDASGDGTYQNPYKTVTAGIANRGALTVVKIIDSSTYTENPDIDFNGDLTLEAEEGFVPVLSPSDSRWIMQANAKSGDKIFAGLYMDGLNFSQYSIRLESMVVTAPDEIKVIDCTQTNFLGNTGAAADNTIEGILFLQNINNGTVTVQNCYSFSNNKGRARARAIGIQTNSASSVVDQCIIVDSYSGIWSQKSGITNCIIYDCVDFGIISLNSAGYTIRNLVIRNCDYGYRNVVVGAPTVHDIIFNNNTDHGMTSDVVITITYCNFVGNGTDHDANVTSNNEISGDPEFSSTAGTIRLGIGAKSSCYRADTGSDDTGAIFRSIIISQDTIVINGFNFTGLNFFNNAITQVGSTDRSGHSIKWCTFEDYNGIIVDIHGVFNAGVFEKTDVDLLNCICRDSGSAVNFSVGGNDVQDCVFYGFSLRGVYFNRANDLIEHNSFYNCGVGLYMASNGSAIIKNNIFHGNNSYDFFSDISVSITYCITTGSLNNVNITHDSNITDDPLFLNETTGSEDLNIKTIFGGFSINSPAYLTADDSRDLGAYDVDRSIDEEGWRQFVLDVNPFTVNEENKGKGMIVTADMLGSSSMFGKAFKRIFPLIWNQNTATTKEQTEKIKYFSTLVPTWENEKTKSQCQLRYKPIPTAHIDTGTSATVDADDLTLTDSGKTWNPDEHKGFYIGIIFTSGANMVIDGSANTGTVAGAGWTVNEWAGYYLKYDGYTYFIKSNTATVLTLSDPYDTLTSATVNYSIEKYFEVKDNTGTVLNLYDDNSELVDGTYDYYVDFALTRSMSPDFKFLQPGFNPTQDEHKTGYGLTLEQI